MSKQDEQLQTILRAIERIAQPIPAIPAIQAIPAIPAIPSIVPSGDHDLLIKLETKLDGLIADVKVLNDNTGKTLSDHETRIRSSEKSITRILSYGTVLIFLVGIVEFLISKFL